MKTQFLKYAIIFFIVVGVVLWSLNFIFFNKNAPRSKAAGETMSLSFNPSSVTPSVNSDFTVSLLASPSVATVLRGYATGIFFDNTVLALKSIQYNVGSASAELGQTDADLTTINAEGYVSIIANDTTSTGYTLTTPNGAELVTLTFTAIKADPTTIEFDDSEFYSVDDSAVLTNPWTYAATGLSVNGGVVEPTGEPITTCTSFSDDFSGTELNNEKWSIWTSNGGTVGVADGQATLYIPGSTEPEYITIGTGKQISGNFSLEVTLKGHSNLDDKLTSNFFFRITNGGDWSKTISIFKPFNKSPGGLGVFWKDTDGDKSEGVQVVVDHDTNVRVKFERIDGTIKTYYMLDGGEYTLIKQFDNYYAGNMTFDIGVDIWEPDFPQASGIIDDFNITCPEQQPTAVPTEPGGGNVGGNTSLNLKLKFQGITTQPTTRELNSMQVRAKIGGCGLTEPTDYMTGSFSADTNAVWSGSIEGFNLPACSNGFYNVYVKGPYHVQKKICDLVPTETAGGTYRCSDGKITLNSGANSLDFSGILQLSGDLPPQNGTVDAYDISLVRNCIGKTDETCLNNADVNRDGKVDTQDYSLIIASLSVKSDEE